MSREGRALRAGLALLGVPPRRLAAPIALAGATSLWRILALALWLPLLTTVLTGELGAGRRLAALADLVPPTVDRATLLAALAGAILLVTLAKAASAHRADRAVADLAAAAEVRLGEKLLRRHLRFARHRLLDAGPAGTVRNLSRLPARAARLVRWVVRAGASALEMTLYALLMLWLAPALAGVALALLAAYFLGVRRLVERAEERAGEEEDAEDEAAAEVQGLARNLLLVRLSTPEDEAVAAFRDSAVRRTALAGRRRAALALIDEARQAVGVLLLVAFVLAVGWALARFDGGAVSRYLVFFFVFRRALGAFATVQRLPRQWRSIRQRLDEAAALLAAGGDAEVPSGDRPMPPLAAGLAVRRLDFAYEPDRPALAGVSFNAPRGRLTVLVGPNGSGKSTLVELLLRLRDAPPATLFADDVDLREVELGALRRATGYAGPEPMLLDGTLRDNLTIGLGEVAEERLWAAAEAVGLAPLVRGLEGGFDHAVGDDGLRLSQGERQRLALARVLVRDPALVLLDEATSSLDAESERRAMEALADLARDRVVVAVSHRLASVPASAHVVVLDGGQVVEEGPCAELAARSGPFRRLLDAAAAEAPPVPRLTAAR